MTKLLNVLPLRGATAFEKFCDSLQLAGHVFVAELLRDEGIRLTAYTLVNVYVDLVVFTRVAGTS